MQAAGVHIRGVLYTMRLLDALFYCFSPIIAAYVLRILQRRTILARLGSRRLIIADIEYVHKVRQRPWL